MTNRKIEFPLRLDSEARVGNSSQDLDVKFLSDLANRLRASAFDTILQAGHGHLGASSSSVELMTALYFGGILHYNPKDSNDQLRDRVYVRGHIGPLRYSIFALLGWIDYKELKTYRQYGTRLKGHESMHSTPGVDITPSGSLGMLLSYGAGAAYVTKQLGLEAKHFVFLGDGEEQEGNVSEAARHIASLGLDNLVCILDKNNKQLSRPTNEVDVADIGMVWKGYGWDVLEIEDGHDISAIQETLRTAISNERPTFVIAKTVKGKGIEGAEKHFSGYHTLSACQDRTVVQDAVGETINSLSSEDMSILTSHLATVGVRGSKPDLSHTKLRKYNIPIPVSPDDNINLDDSQVRYFKNLVSVVKEQGMPFFFMTPDLVQKPVVQLAGLDKATGFIDTGIREQHAIAMAHGMSQINPNARIFINYFDAFLYRASDQLNAAAQGKSRIIILSEMSGLTQGQNGETHQSSGQPAIPLYMPGVTFFEPGDVQDLYNILNHCFSENPGIVIIRSHRADIQPFERNPEDQRNISSYRVFDTDYEPKLVMVGSGYVLGGLIQAAKQLETEFGLPTRVVNVVNPKELSSDFVSLLGDEKPVLTAYNGNPAVLQAAVAQAVMSCNGPRPSIIKGHGFYFGDTGRIDELTRAYRFDCDGIISVVKEHFDFGL